MLIQKVVQNKHHPSIIIMNLYYSNVNDYQKSVDSCGILQFGTYTESSHWVKASLLKYLFQAFIWCIRDIKFYTKYIIDKELGLVHKTFTHERYEDFLFLFKRIILVFGIRFS